MSQKRRSSKRRSQKRKSAKKSERKSASKSARKSASKSARKSARKTAKRSSSRRTSSKRIKKSSRRYSKKNQKGGLIPGSADQSSDLTFRRSSTRLGPDGMYGVVSYGNQDNYSPMPSNNDQEIVQRGGGIFDWFFNLFGFFNMVGGAYVYNADTDECPVCKGVGSQEDFGGNQIQICSNGHHAHPYCIGEWYKIANTCPTCNISVENFPLYVQLNPTKTTQIRYNPDNYAPTESVYEVETYGTASFNLQNILQNNDYTEAYNAFRSNNGRQYIMQSLNEIDVQRDEDIYFGNSSPDSPSMESSFIVRFLNSLNVASALFDVFRETGDQDTLINNTGPLIDLYARDSNLNIIMWLREHGYHASFEFLENAASRQQLQAMMWYLTSYNVDPLGQEILTLIRELQEDQNTASVNVLVSYINSVVEEPPQRTLRRHNAM